MNVQYGCGKCAPDNWINFDISPTLRLEKLPIIGKLFIRKEWGAYPENVRVGNIVKGLPDIREESVDNVYCSHVLEHLSFSDLKTALINTQKMMKKGGVFRLVVPDLELMVREYIEDKAKGNKDAGHRLMEKTIMGVISRPNTFINKLTNSFGNSKHLWNYDFESMSLELEKAGFKKIRRAVFNDSERSAFLDLEDTGRWNYCLGIECIK